MGSYGEAWIKILVHGFIAFPWYCIKFVLDGFRCRSFLTPLKQNCSMNGRNKGTFAVPIAFEALAFLLTVIALLFYNGAACPDIPVAYSSVSGLLAKDPNATAPHTNTAAVRPVAAFPSILGSHADETAQRMYGYTTSESRLFALLDEESIIELQSACNVSAAAGGKYINAKGVEATYMGSGFPASPYFGAAVANGDMSRECDFLTISQNCMCVGVLGKEAHKECHGKANSGMGMLAANGSYIDNTDRAPVCKAHAGLHRYADMSNLGNKWSSNTCLFLMVASLMSFSRLVAIIAFPGELRKPGAMWVNGWPAGLMCLAATSGMRNFGAWLKSSGVNYFDDDMLIFGYNKNKVWGKMYPYVDDKMGKSLSNLYIITMVAVFLNICCSFFSSEAYCNDLTGHAYSKENVQARVRNSRKQKC